MAGPLRRPRQRPDRHRPAARTTWREGQATADHTDLTTRWTQHHAAAVADDERTARQRAAGLTDQHRRALPAPAHPSPGPPPAPSSPTSASNRPCVTPCRTIVATPSAPNAPSTPPARPPRAWTFPARTTHAAPNTDQGAARVSAGEHAG
ncbi:hypothetical protein GCM10009678_79130 [Actinomadura kijaniata]